jgi:hypothetical protein
MGQPGSGPTRRTAANVAVLLLSLGLFLAQSPQAGFIELVLDLSTILAAVFAAIQVLLPVPLLPRQPREVGGERLKNAISDLLGSLRKEVRGESVKLVRGSGPLDVECVSGPGASQRYTCDQILRQGTWILVSNSRSCRAVFGLRLAECALGTERPKVPVILHAGAWDAVEGLRSEIARQLCRMSGLRDSLTETVQEGHGKVATLAEWLVDFLAAEGRLVLIVDGLPKDRGERKNALKRLGEFAFSHVGHPVPLMLLCEQTECAVAKAGLIRRKTSPTIVMLQPTKAANAPKLLDEAYEGLHRAKRLLKALAMYKRRTEEETTAPWRLIAAMPAWRGCCAAVRTLMLLNAGWGVMALAVRLGGARGVFGESAVARDWASLGTRFPRLNGYTGHEAHDLARAVAPWGSPVTIETAIAAGAVAAGLLAFSAFPPKSRPDTSHVITSPAKALEEEWQYRWRWWCARTVAISLALWRCCGLPPAAAYVLYALCYAVTAALLGGPGGMSRAYAEARLGLWLCGRTPWDMRGVLEDMRERGILVYIGDGYDFFDDVFEARLTARRLPVSAKTRSAGRSVPVGLRRQWERVRGSLP